MSEIKESVDNVLDTIENLLETHRDLMIVKFVQHFSTNSSLAVIGILVLLLVLLILFFLGIGFSWWLGEYLENMKAGFFIVGGVYSVVLLIMLLLSRKVLLPLFRDLIISKIYEED